MALDHSSHPISNDGSGHSEKPACTEANRLGVDAAAESPRLVVSPILAAIAKQIVTRNHYLHSFPGGTQLSLGVFDDGLLKGAVTFGVGPKNAHRLVDGAEARDCLTLTRLWLDDLLPRNSESTVIGACLKALRLHTGVRFVLTYADPAQGHVGTIYQASNWTYTGLSEAMPMYDLGDGIPRHSRTVSNSLGSHSMRYFAERGVKLVPVPQTAKHRYLYFVDRAWRKRLRATELPYPKKEDPDGNR